MNKLSFATSLSVLLLLSCGKGGTNDSVEEFLAKDTALSIIEEAPLKPDTTLNETQVDSMAVSLSVGLQSLFPEYDTMANNQFHLLDRTGSRSEKIMLKKTTTVPYGRSSEVTPRAYIFHYHFEDSVSCFNALDKWLDCFGSDCTPVEYGKDLKFVKTPPTYILVGSASIVILKYSCESVRNDWASFEESLRVHFGFRVVNQIKIECGGPLKWSD